MEHSNVFYILEYNSKEKTQSFIPVEKAKVFKNNFDLDLFTYNKKISEGTTGLKLCDEMSLELFEKFIEKNGGVIKLNSLIQEQIKNEKISPRYTRPDEKKKDLFPPKEKDASKVMARDSYNKRHYYIKIQSEHNGKARDFYVLESQKDENNATLYVLCNGIMISIDQRHRIECAHEGMEKINDDILGHIESLFNKAIANEYTWIDLGYALVLNRVDEARQHNEVIRQMRKADNDARDAERKAKQEQQEREIKEFIQNQIDEAEQSIKSKTKYTNDCVKNSDTSVVLYLMKKYEIPVPLKTQGWINKALYSLTMIGDKYSYQYYKSSSDSTVFSKYLNMLVEKIQAA